MSEFEYEKSLWEATNAGLASRKEAGITPPTAADNTPPAKGIEQATPKRHRPKDIVTRPKRKGSEGKTKGPSHESPKTGRPSSGRNKDVKSRLTKGAPVRIKKINPEKIKFKPLNEMADMQVPRLAHNLERALFNPGVFQLQDPRSKVYNFDPYLSSIMPVDEFDFDALREYVSSSKDEKLHAMSKEHNAKYCGSTSSMTSVLSHFHYLISNWRPPEFPSITQSFKRDSDNFTQLTRAPASTFIHHNDGVYAMDADKEYDFGRENILMMLGHSLERLLTLPPEQFEQFRRDRSHLIPQETKDAGADAFHYGTIGKFMMRSQLDAQDPRLPGTGVFDIKTRAVLPIRIDLESYKDHTGYEIKNRFGQLESYEREYYDLIRAAFLRYSLQVRIGRMDGCFVAYHNTQRIFGFQYVSLSEMDQALHGTPNPELGDQEFRLSLRMLEDLLDMATAKYPGRKLQIHVETRDTTPPVMYFFARPVSDEEVRKSEEKAISLIDKTQSDIVKARAEEEVLSETDQVDEDTVESESDPTEEEEDAVSEDGSESSLITAEGNPVWQEMIAKVEEVVENEAMGVDSVRDAVQDALQENDLLSTNTEDEPHPSLETLVEALVAEMTGSRESREPTNVDAADSDAAAQESSRESETSADAQATESRTASDSPAEHDSDSVAARTKELKELILRFTKAVDHNASQARGFERALGELLIRARPQTGISEDGRGAVPEEGAAAEEQPHADQAQDGLAQSQTEHESSAEELESTNEGQISTEPEAAPAETVNGGAPVGMAGAESSQEPPKRSKSGERTFEVPEELFSAVVSVVNTQGGETVPRPVDDGKKLKWTAHYTIYEMDRKQAEKVYPALRKRRFDVFGNPNKKTINPKDRAAFLKMSKESAKQRKQEQASKKPIFVAWDEKPLPRKKKAKQ